MRAVNLIPTDLRRGGGELGRSGGGAYVLLGVLTAALVLVVLYVTAGNQIAERKSEVTRLQGQAAAAQSEAARLAPYSQFAALAQARATTVRQLAASRFDWHRSLTDLARVVPANTSLQALTASIAPGSGGAGIALRSAIQAPAFELTGCTGTQDDVARLVSRLRVITGVTRVTLQDSQKSDSGQGASGVGAAGALTAPGCGAGAPTFHIVVFFQPPPGVPTSAATLGAPATVTPAQAVTAPGATATPSAGMPAVTPSAGTPAVTPSAAASPTVAATPAGTAVAPIPGGSK